MDPLQFFTDPVLRAPTIGCMLMAFSAAIVGVIAFIRRRSLLGESLSHATYPGVIIAVGIGSLLFTAESGMLAPFVLGGAFVSALLGLWVIEVLENRFKVRQDSALCIVLSGFFGIGVTIASRLQFVQPVAYRQMQMYLYGQAATMTDLHIVIYTLLTCIVLATVLLFRKELEVSCFDRSFARSVGINLKLVDAVVFLLIVLALVIGIRSVGVVLMSAMLIAAPAAARQYTDKLNVLFVLAGFFGLLSGFLGNYCSVVFGDILQTYFPERRVSLPTGPMIVLVASALCFLSLLFAPPRGLIVRMCRAVLFRNRCLRENLLKAMWRFGPEISFTLRDLQATQSSSRFYLYLLLFQLSSQGWVTKRRHGHFKLTPDGRQRAAHIIRVHRLWEVYLVNYLGVGAERVHPNAEEMEHVLTDELERELTELLRDPQHDPHQQPIPPKESTL